MMVKLKCGASYRLMSNMADMLEAGELCDIMIKTGTHLMKAHKCVLAAGLGYFRSNFRFSESCRNGTETISHDLSHLGCDGAIIQSVIESLYTNTIELNDENLEDILCLADFLLYRDLSNCVNRYMNESLKINNAMTYFKLCIQYNLDSFPVYYSACSIIRYRFHDYLIYQENTHELDWNVFVSMHTHGLLDLCSPLQLMTFFLEKIKKDFLRTNDKRDDDIVSVLIFLENIFLCHNDDTAKGHWNPRLRDYLVEWLLINRQYNANNNLVIKLLMLLFCKFSRGYENSPDTRGLTSGAQSSQRTVVNNLDLALPPLKRAAESGNNWPFYKDSSDKKIRLNLPVVGSFPTCAKLDLSVSAEMLTLSSSVQSLDPEHRIQRLHQNFSQQLDKKCHITFEICSSLEDTFTINSDSLDKTLVVLAPTSENVTVESLVLKKEIKFRLHFYDVEFRIWRESIHLELLCHNGLIPEEEWWKMAFFRGKLYLFSLGQNVGKEYCFNTTKWTDLYCEDIFTSRSNARNERLRANSIIPVAVGDKLLVVSSEEGRAQNHIYQFHPETKNFSHVTAIQSKPFSKWMVHSNELFMITSSHPCSETFAVQDIYIYDARTRDLRSRRVHLPEYCDLSSALENGGNLYLLNDDSHYQQLDLNTFNASDWVEISNPSFKNHIAGLDRFGLTGSFPPCTLKHPTVNAGSSSWTFDKNEKKGPLSLREIRVTDKGEFHFNTDCHPTPPFPLVSAMCMARTERRILDRMEQAKFDPLYFRQLPSDYTC